MKGREEQEVESITPWEGADGNGTGNIILRFSRSMKGSQPISPNAPVRRNN
jgi:hypothetical protein